MHIITYFNVYFYAHVSRKGLHEYSWQNMNEKILKGVIRLVLPGIERNGIVVEIVPNKKILDWDYNLDHAENESM